MRVQYKPKMINKVREAQIAADSIGEEIDFIEVTDREWAALIEELRLPPITGGQLTVNGVDIFKKSPAQDDDEEEELF